jgi:putative membrane protein
MKQSVFLKKLNLDAKALDSIRAGVQNAEVKTTGEIVIAATPQSSRYSFWELFAAVIFSAVVFAVFLPFADKINAWMITHYWQIYGWYLPAFYGIMCFAIIALGFYFANIPVIDRLVIPHRVQNGIVTNRAFRFFTESGVYDTAEHSGILIFISYLERQVRIVADKGISAKIPQDLWNIIADGLAEGIGKGETGTAILDAIEKCGELLSEHFPAHEQNPDELSDGMIILGGDEWN